MTDLYQRNGGEPAPLPSIAFDERNFAYTQPYAEEDLAMLGFSPAPAQPEFDPATQRVEWRDGAWVVVDLPPAPPQSAPAPTVLGRLRFIVLCQTAGGMTDAMLVEAQKNPAFEAFWIKYQMASAVERDDPITRGALDALAAGGYLPNGKAAVIAAWPVE